MAFRTMLIFPVLVSLVACGGGAQSQGSHPQQPEPTNTTSGSGDQADMGGAGSNSTPSTNGTTADTTPSTHSTANSNGTSNAGSSPTATGAASAKTATGSAPAAAAPAVDAPHPLGPTTLKGKLAGGDFAAKVALLNDAAVGKEVFLTIVDRDMTCSQAQLADGDKHVQVRVPWKTDHYELSTKALSVKFGVQRGKKDLVGEASRGSVDVLSAPKTEESIGRIRIHAGAPKESIDGEIDVKVCMDLR